jgi:hypothetical protein
LPKSPELPKIAEIELRFSPFPRSIFSILNLSSALAAKLLLAIQTARTAAFQFGFFGNFGDSGNSPLLDPAYRFLLNYF